MAKVFLIKSRPRIRQRKREMYTPPNLQKAKETIQLARKLKLFSKGNFIFGFPTETREEVLQTIRWMRESELDAVCLSFFTALPGSEFGYKQKKDLHRTPSLYDGHNFMHITRNYSYLNKNDLESLRNYAFYRFYLSRKRLAEGSTRHIFWRCLHAFNFLPTILKIPLTHPSP